MTGSEIVAIELNLLEQSALKLDVSWFNGTCRGSGSDKLTSY